MTAGATGPAGATLSIDVTIARRAFEVAASLEIPAGERIALFGPSGAGKTTLLEAIAGLVTPAKGQVRLGDAVLSQPPEPPTRFQRSVRRSTGPARALGAAGRHVSTVRQPVALFPHLDVAHNVAYGASDHALVERAVEGAGLADLATVRPAALSGGQRQRVQVARALARRHSVLLLDEPFSAVDPSARRQLWALVEARLLEDGATAILVTHDLEEAQAFAQRLVVMDEGRILADGDPHGLVAAPLERRVAELVGYRSFLAVERAGDSRTDPESAASVTLRAEELALDEARTIAGSWPDRGVVLSGTVAACHPSGPKWRCELLVPAGSSLEVSGRVRWVVRTPSLVTVLIEDPPGVGTDLYVTAIGPPVVASVASAGVQGG